MTRLEAALTQLTRYLQHHLPFPPPFWQEGLSLMAMEADLASLPCVLPHELLAWYQWGNGLQDAVQAWMKPFGFTELFMIPKILTFEKAVEEYSYRRALAAKLVAELSVMADEDPDEMWHPQWFPVAGSDRWYHVAWCASTPQESAAVYYVDRSETGTVALAYDSVTTMLETLVACCDTGACILESTGRWHVDQWEEAQIRRALNPHRTSWWLQQVPGARTLEDLVAALHHRTHDQGQHIDSKAADALQELRDPRTVPLLRDAVHAPDVIARRQAVRVLAAFPLPQTLDLVLPALDDPDDTVRWNATKTLGALGDRRAVGPLVQAMDDPVYWVRHAVCWSLGQLGDARAVAPLIATLRDNPSSGIRAVAGRALGELGDARAIEPLRQALDDPDAEVHNVAAYCLKNLERLLSSSR